MKAREVIDDVIAGGAVMDEEAMLFALNCLEKEIADFTKKEYKEIDMDGELQAPGQFFTMYREYLMRENALRSEDWDCCQMHNGIFLNNFSEFKKYVVRNTKPKEQAFKNDWRW